MKRDVLLIAIFAMIFVPASALRMADLGNRPMHTDEAVQAVKFGQLLEQGRYVYDPREYHGPSLNYLTLPVAAAGSRSELTQINETQLRLVPAVFGLFLIALLWLIRDGLGRAAVLWAALLTALSPAMVFYSRYYIHEMLLVGFSLGAIVALIRLESWAGSAGRQSASSGRDAWLRPVGWLIMLGLSLGMMHATKETCVVPMFALSVAGLLAMPNMKRTPRRHLLVAVVVVALTGVTVSAVLFSSLLSNPQGIVDSVTTYAHYLGRAAGQGTAGSHAYPWYHYFHLLFWWRADSGPVWTELPVGLLALVGLAAAALARGLTPGTLWPVRFLAVYTVITAAVYSALPYKTPWSMLGFYHATILLAGVGAAVLVRAAPGKMLKVATVAVLAAAVAHLGWQAWKATRVAYDDPGNPYVYAHTTRDVPLLAQQIRQIAACGGSGKEVTVHVICPNHDYWPLPWYFRGLPRVGWFDRIPTNALAPVIITRPELEPALVEHLYVEQPPGRRSLYVPLPPSQRTKGEDWLLRPNVPLRAYVRLDVWDTYRRALGNPDAHGRPQGR